GKTTIAALLIRSIIDAGKGPVLAVDADPNANLHEALGLAIHETLGNMREDAFTRTIPPGMSRNEFIRLRFRQVLVESAGFDLIAMGRPEGSGCYCFAHNLLCDAMRDLEREYPFIVIDAEAGMEHISRGTVGRPDVLLIVSDPGARGMRTVGRIQEIALSLGFSPQSMHLVINRKKDSGSPLITERPSLIGVVPEDPAIEQADLQGIAIATIPDQSPARRAVRDIATRIRAICRHTGSS
ncbi:MAG: carbon monoxide dehydrogenase maturation protein, partial [Methanomicrobiales archaeon]|nr:carbon monoxide dehydrogenase maturation protein [Methanomicrobiales archaeon]